MAYDAGMVTIAKSPAVYDLEKRLARLKGEMAACEARAEELRNLILTSAKR